MDDHSEPLHIGLGINGDASEDIELPAAGRETLHRLGGQRAPGTVTQERDGDVIRAAPAGDRRHDDSLERIVFLMLSERGGDAPQIVIDVPSKRLNENPSKFSL